MSKDSLYQQLRSHLAYLELGAAAEALLTQLDAARTTKIDHTEFLEQLRFNGSLQHRLVGLSVGVR